MNRLIRMPSTRRLPYAEAALAAPSLATRDAVGQVRHVSARRVARKKQIKKFRKKWIDPYDSSKDAIMKSDAYKAYREHPSSMQITGGENILGRIVMGDYSRFSKVDFGLKKEVDFPREEMMEGREAGTRVAYPLVRLEDDFNEPEVDYAKATSLPSLQAERARLLHEMTKEKNPVQFIRGRVTTQKPGGFIVRALGEEFFLPGSLALGMPPPILGRTFTFCVQSLVMSTTPARGRQEGEGNKVFVDGLVNGYNAVLLIVSNLVARDDMWEASGGGSSKERLQYLRMLSALAMKKSYELRQSFNQDLSRTRHYKPIEFGLFSSDSGRRSAASAIGEVETLYRKPTFTAHKDGPIGFD